MHRAADKWDIRFFELCELIASWSEDASRKIGAVIVGPGNEVRATGFNGLPRGVKADRPERHSREGKQKYLWYEHAERNAIYNLVRSGCAGSSCVMYCNSFPCADCTRAIIQAGLSELRTFAPDFNDPNFGHHYAVSDTMLREAGVTLTLFDRSDSLIRRAFVRHDP